MDFYLWNMENKKLFKKMQFFFLLLLSNREIIDCNMGILVINVALINFTNIQGILQLFEYRISCFLFWEVQQITEKVIYEKKLSLFKFKILLL